MDKRSSLFFPTVGDEEEIFFLSLKSDFSERRFFVVTQERASVPLKERLNR
jgi:hypothetical protein